MQTSAFGGGRMQDKTFVLTVYLDGSGDLQFHAGPEGDFCEDVGPCDGVRVLREFVIAGRSWPSVASRSRSG